MKRVGEALSPMAAPVVHLNVGGVFFDVSRETLRHCEYFDAYLHGRMNFSLDDKGRIFVDRNGETFAVLLDCIRKGKRPAQKFIDAIKQDLLDECEYFGLGWLARKIKGQISPLDLRPTDRQIYNDELSHKHVLMDVFQCDVARKPDADLQLPLLFVGDVSHSLVEDYASFMKRLDIRSGGLLARLPRVPGLMVAGGAIIGALTNAEAGDFDIFLQSSPNTDDNFQQIMDAIRRGQEERHGRSSKLLITRSRCAVTVYRSSVGQPGMDATPIQIITTTYPSPEELLANFDVDCCCFVWLPEQNRVMCSPRGLRALQYRVNIADGRFTGSYCRRLEKYAARGFAIAIPGLDCDQINPNVFKGHHALLTNCDLLVRTSRSPAWSASDKSDTVTAQACRITFQHTEIGRVVKGVERILVLDAARRGVLEVERRAPTPVYCERHKRLTLRNECDAVGLVRLGSGAVSLVANAKLDCASDVDYEGYSVAPTVVAQQLLLDIFQQEQIAMGEETLMEDAFWKGGKMEQLAKEMRRRCTERLHASLEQLILNCLRKDTRIPFVYDLVMCNGTSVEDLNFVRDAGRPPFFALDAAHFISKYGIEQKLTFREAKERTPTPSIDWFSAVYR